MKSVELPPQELRQRNRRVAMLLLGWIALLVVLSLIVVWVKN